MIAPRVRWRICTYPGCNRFRDFPSGRTSVHLALKYPYCGFHKNPANRESPEERRRRILQEEVDR